MSIEVIQGTNQKPVSSTELAKLLSQRTDLSGQLFIGYPIIGTSEGPHVIDALLVSNDKGVVILDLIEGTDTTNYEFRQDDSANKLEARLRLHRGLVRRRDLLVPIHTVSFAPGMVNLREHAKDNYPLANLGTLVSELKSLEWVAPEFHIYEATLSAIESISTIRQTKTRRRIEREDSRGAKLQRLEASIATLDTMQSKAVIETVEGVQRIRGLAGSGKTIVLALKAAYLHAQHPEWRIAVTFNTRSLKGYFRRLINNFALEQTSEEPDWERLRIVNAWGAPGRNERDGIYYEFCRAHDVEYLDFQSARRAFRRGKEFEEACRRAIQQAQESKEIYDAILVDEAQDFPPAFLQLCYQMLNAPKRLVYAYDELQSLTGESLPSPEEIFGSNADGSPKVPFDDTDNSVPKRDIILDKCYRNSRPVLVTAHALGFGVYREPQNQSGTGLIQMFDHPKLWEDIGYQQRDGEIQEDSPVTLYRTEDTSPRFLEDHSDVDDLIQFITFASEEEQAKWVAEAIKNDLTNSELRHDDIVVINPDPLTTRKKVGQIRRLLLDIGINSHLAGVDTDPDVFFEEGSVTFTGIFRAKGNETGMVYVINSHDCHSASLNLATKRNQLFTAITRSKAWVRLLGVGSDMKELSREYSKLKEQDFELRFVYPTDEQREQLRIVHRDMGREERRQLENRQRSLDDLIEDIEAGSVHVEDLSDNSLVRLREILDGGKRRANS